MYAGVAESLHYYLRERVYTSKDAFEITLGDRIATVLLRADAVQGTGRGFAGSFSSYGTSLIIDIY